ncbi:MAG: hypothetical protein JSU66_13615 [Deltaproteobacteria bacterium]|nr:MAG: hypothetical protein JSU66_13615 [Deltaproteobacteria bacterium]
MASSPGERTRYYADVRGVEAIAKAYADRFVYDGTHSAFRRCRHGAPATDVPRDRSAVCVPNRDPVENRARGAGLAARRPPAQIRPAAAELRCVSEVA